jgi:hypothetical protein
LGKAAVPWRWIAIAAVAVAAGAITVALATRKSELDVLEANLASEELSVRQNALACLVEGWDRVAAIDDSRAEAALRGAVERDRDEQTRTATLDAIERRPELAAHTLPWLDVADPRALRVRHAATRAVVRRNAAHLLGRIADGASKGPLEEAFKAEVDEEAKGAMLDAMQALRRQ